VSEPPRNRKQRRALQRHAKQRRRPTEHWLVKAKRDREIQALLDGLRTPDYPLVRIDEIADFQEEVRQPPPTDAV
jgi:hypothetical protein